jgi:hypothetical protein
MFYHGSVLARTMYPFVSWTCAILVEPSTPHPDHFKRVSRFLVEGAVKRRDMWASSGEAHKHFRERVFKSWDSRSIDLHVVRIRVHFYSRYLYVLIDGQRYGLRALPTLTYPDKTQGVTLACTKVQEAVRCRAAHPSSVSFDARTRPL